MINPEYETHIDIQTSCTRDEAVGMMLGLLQGPVHAWPRNNDAAPEELEIIDSHTYSLKDDLEERRDSLETDLSEAKLDNLPDDDITEKREALQKFDVLIDRARICSRHIDDEIAKGESSALRVDKRAKGSSTEIRYTIVSVEEWAKTNPEFSTFVPFQKHGTENSSMQPEFPQESGRALSKTKTENLNTTFAFLIEAFAQTADRYGKSAGKPNVSAIAEHIARLAFEASKPDTITGQGDEAIKGRIEEAMRIKKGKLRAK